jgi:hypothetical protein
MDDKTLERLAEIAHQARDIARDAAGQSSIREPGSVDLWDLDQILERQEALGRLVAELAELAGTGRN